MQINSDLSGPTPTARTISAAKQLEQAFLAEMLKYAGPKASEGSFSGGVGEAQFASFLTDSYAETLSGALDLGLAAQLKGVAE